MLKDKKSDTAKNGPGLSPYQTVSLVIIQAKKEGWGGGLKKTFKNAAIISSKAGSGRA